MLGFFLTTGLTMTQGTGNNEGDSLRAICRARTYLMVCFLTFPLYAWGVTELLNQGQDISLFMLVYMAIYAGFGINASIKRCPRCHGQFYVRRLFLNPMVTRCQHCGVSCKEAR